MNDYTFNLKINELSKTQEKILSELSSLKIAIHPDLELWDNSDMIRNWKTSERTLASWRANGWIEYIQVGHKIFYTQENRANFLNQFKRIGGEDE